MNLLIRTLQKQGIPVVLQYCIFSIVAAACLTPFFYSSCNLVYGIFLLSQPIIFIGVCLAYKSHSKQHIARKILVAGVLILVTILFLHHLIFFGFNINPEIVTNLKGIGVALVGCFSYMHIYIFEKKFGLKGLCIDYNLMTIAITCFVFLLLPDFLNKFLYSFTLDQQLASINLYVSITVFGLTAIHIYMTKEFDLVHKLRVTLNTLFALHFVFEAIIIFELSNNLSLIKALSLSVIHMAGALVILFLYLEKLTSDFSSASPVKVGNLFMWVSCKVALIAIPSGLIYRAVTNAPDIDILFVGIANIIISSIVIWRIIGLLKSYNGNKKALNSILKINTVSKLPNFQAYLEKFTLSVIKNILLVYVNIDDFRSINDLYGRDAGDAVLKNLAKKLKKLPFNIYTAHVQSDQFLIMFKIDDEDEIIEIVQKIQTSLGSWDVINDIRIAVPLTYGASYDKKVNPERLARQAEIAVKKAREDHSNFVLYDQDTKHSKIPRNELRQILQKAVDEAYLPVHFQPIYNLEDGSLKALEMLIRVNSSKYGLLQPAQFIDQARSYALLTALTQICIKMLSKYKHEIGDTTVNINLPPYMLKSHKLINNFIDVFNEEGLDPMQYCIEITEDEGITVDELLPAIKALRAQSFSIAMDDFGTGYSSLERLSILDVDTVKIDRSILLTSETGNSTILEWAISLAKRLGVSVVVEGVETKEQLSLVKLLGADSVQGFLYSKPVSACEVPNIPMNTKDIILA